MLRSEAHYERNRLMAVKAGAEVMTEARQYKLVVSRRPFS